MYRHNGLLIAQYQDSEGPIEVVDHEGVRRLHFGSGAVQSCMLLRDPGHLCANYERTMMACLLFNPEPVSTLMIGLGGASLARFMLQHNEHGRVQVVELRPQMLEVARNHFVLPQDARLQVTLGCGAQYVAQQHIDKAGTHDLILVDAYHADGMAQAVASEEFFRHCHSLLSDRGMLVINLWRSDKTMISAITSCLVKLFKWRAHFMPVRGSNNMIGFAFADGMPQFKLQALEAQAQRLQQALQLDFPDYLQDLRLGDPLGRLFIDA